MLRFVRNLLYYITTKTIVMDELTKDFFKHQVLQYYRSFCSGTSSDGKMKHLKYIYNQMLENPCDEFIEYIDLCNQIISQ